MFQTGVPGRLEATPLVVDGSMYLTGPDNHAWALDARTGRQIWHYRRQLPERLNICCGRVNRGFAIRGDRLYMTTLDAHLVALDARTGNVLFDVEIDDHTKSYTATVAPLIVKDKVIVGIAGAEYGIRGFIDAFDANTGKKAWRFWTVPEPGQPGGNTWSGDAWRRGGGSTWVTGAYDPTLNLVYWGTGNPSPDSLGDVRPGDNLYTDSVVALDADTGTLRWHYQFTPHDVHDWDAVQVPILADLTINGAPRKVLMTANRNGFFYTLDRTNGALLRARPFVRTTWAQEVGQDGKPILLEANRIGPEGTVTCPGRGRRHQLDVAFVQSGHRVVLRHDARSVREVLRLPSGVPPRSPVLGRRGRKHSRGARLRRPARDRSCLRARALGVQVSAAGDGWHIEHGVRPGVRRRRRWQRDGIRRGERQEPVAAANRGSLRAGPMSFMLNGKQYVVVASGGTVIAFALPEGR